MLVLCSVLSAGLTLSLPVELSVILQLLQRSLGLTPQVCLLLFLFRCMSGGPDYYGASQLARQILYPIL